MTFKTDREAGRWLEYWKSVLGLRDWLVTVRLVGANELESLHQMGHCSFYTDRKEAVVRLLKAGHETNCEVPMDHEETLVHELLHLHFAPLSAVAEIGDDDKAFALVEEQAIVAMARGYVWLRRGGRGK